MRSSERNATTSSEPPTHGGGMGTEVVGRGMLREDLVIGREGGSSSASVGAWEVDGWLIMLLQGVA